MNAATAQKIADFLDSWLAYRARFSSLPGFSVSIQAGDKLIFSKAYGYADLKTKEPLTATHLFQVASQAKMLTAVAIMQFIEAGTLKLDDPASLHLPWLKAHPDKQFHSVTIRHLLSHSAGIIRGESSNDYWLFKKPGPSKSRFQKIVLNAPLAFKPGSDVKYANIGYGLLGLIIEQLSGRSYAQHIAKTILQPLNLTQAVTDYSSTIRASIPTGYGHRNQAITPRRPLNVLAPAAGLHATSELMCQFIATLCNGNTTFLSDTSKQAMQKTQAKVAHGYNEGEEFGLGMLIHKVGNRRIVGHDGHVAGHMSATYFDPKGNIAVSICSNTKDAPIFAMISGIFGVIDFFMNNPETESPFNVRLVNEISTIQIIRSGKTFLAIDPDDWEPFAYYETLKKVNDTTLRVTTPGSIFNHNEPVYYTFSHGAIKNVQFAGVTLQPENEL